MLTKNFITNSRENIVNIWKNACNFFIILLPYNKITSFTLGLSHLDQ